MNKKKMDIKEIIDNVAYCGLVCPLDSCFDNCLGCKKGKGCGDNSCYQKKCCIEKNLSGCWECKELPCNKGYFSKKEKSYGKFVGCIEHIKKYGLKKHIEKLIENQKKGIKYGLNGNYDNMTVEEVLNTLK